MRAKNLNTIDEVPDSSWFTNRIGTTPISVDEIQRGPNRGAPPDPSSWVVIREKTSGVHPGFTAKDARGETWFLEFDPPHFPGGGDRRSRGRNEVLLGARLQPGGDLPDHLRSAPRGDRSEGHDPSAVRQENKVHARRCERHPRTVARNADGTYRVVAGRLIPGKILGNFLFAGTRPDDPNDLVPHEHRRELRALAHLRRVDEPHGSQGSEHA